MGKLTATAGAVRDLLSVLKDHPPPFTLRPDQVEVIEDKLDYPRAGLYAEVGTQHNIVSGRSRHKRVIVLQHESHIDIGNRDFIGQSDKRSIFTD